MFSKYNPILAKLPGQSYHLQESNMFLNFCIDTILVSGKTTASSFKLTYYFT